MHVLLASNEAKWEVAQLSARDRADDDKEAPREQLKEMVAAHQKHLQHDKAARVRTYRLADKELGASSHAISEQILKDRQGLREIPAMSWHGVPHQHVNMLCANFDPVKLPSVTDKQGQQKLFGAEVFAARDLEAAWDRRHALIPRTSWKTPAERQAAMPCFNANFCACKNNVEKGRFLTKIYKRVTQYMKSWMAKSEASLGPSLLSGMLVLEWCGHSSSSSSAGSSSAGAAGQAPQCFFTHVALQYQKPWANTLVKCQVHDELELSQLTQLRASDLTGGSAVTDTSGPSALQLLASRSPSGTMEVLSLWEWLDELSLDYHWEVQGRESLPCPKRGGCCQTSLSRHSLDVSCVEP